MAVRLDALDAVNWILINDSDLQGILGVTDDEDAQVFVSGAAPDEGAPLPFIWTLDRGGEPLDRTFDGGKWSLRETNVAIIVAGVTPEDVGQLITTIENAIDTQAGVEVSATDRDPITVVWIAVTGAGDEQWEDRSGAVVRATTARVITRIT